MNRTEFRLFLKRYAENKCTPEEMTLIDHWYELIGDDELLSSMQEMEWQETEDRLWQKINEGTQPKKSWVIKSRVIKWRWAAIAATISGIIIATALYTFYCKDCDDTYYAAAGNTKEYNEIRNDSKANQQVRLEDGTTVNLYPGAAMKYPHHFHTAKREVYLRGKAFFDVGKDANRPFYVYSNHLVTHVLGTSFMIQPAAATGQVEVSVRSGKVEVYEQTNASQKHTNGGVILTPNQRVLYRQKESSFQTTLVEKPEPVVPVTDMPGMQFKFSDDALRTVVNALGNYYGVEIVVENDSLYNCPFTGALTQHDLYTRLDVVCQTIGATYEIIGTRILIRGKGCK